MTGSHERQPFPEQEPNMPAPVTAIYTPDHVISNKQLADSFESRGITTKSGKKITADAMYGKTGIAQRHYCAELGAPVLERRKEVPEMGTKVALKAINAKGWGRVDAIFSSTSFPFKVSLTSEIAANLRNSGVEVVNVMPDVYAECAAPAWTMHYIRQHPREFEEKNILYVASEYVSPIGDDENLTLVSDAASAIAFKNGKDLEILGSSAKLFPELKDLIRVSIMPEYEPPEGSLVLVEVGQPSDAKSYYGEEVYGLDFRCGEMDGKQVFQWAVSEGTLPPLINDACTQAKMNFAENDKIIPHQANGRILSLFGTLLKVEQSKIVSNIREHGNTGSASTLLAWHEAGISREDRVALIGYGAGMLAVVVEIKVH